MEVAKIQCVEESNLSYTYCVVFLFCFSFHCVHYGASFSGFSIFDSPKFLIRYSPTFIYIALTLLSAMHKHSLIELFFKVEDRTLKRHISIGDFVVYIDTGSLVRYIPSKSCNLADENNNILTEWK
jgi:hypothetical protein